MSQTTLGLGLHWTSYPTTLNVQTPPHLQSLRTPARPRSCQLLCEGGALGGRILAPKWGARSAFWCCSSVPLSAIPKNRKPLSMRTPHQPGRGDTLKHTQKTLFLPWSCFSAACRLLPRGRRPAMAKVQGSQALLMVMFRLHDGHPACLWWWLKVLPAPRFSAL